MQHQYNQGFTLLELLITLVIISVMTAIVGFSVSGHSERTLQGEANKLAAKLNAAQAHMQSGATSLRLVSTAQGYAFEMSEPASDGGIDLTWKRLRNDEVFNEHTLPNNARLLLIQPLQISREPIIPLTIIQLVQNNNNNNHNDNQSSYSYSVKIMNDGIEGWTTQ
jgi:type II secretion system protein H